MSETEETLHRLGAFEPSDAKRVIHLLEAHGIPFGVKADDSALTLPGREVEMFLGMYPTGSQLVVFVPEPDLQKSLDLTKELYPPEKEPEEEMH